MSQKMALVEAPETLADTVYVVPTTPFAVKVGAVAMPFAPVMAVAEATPPGKVPVAPNAGAVKVTVAPLSG